jgi:hypothetical protein
MSVLLSGFHPSFDALSAHADLSDIDGSRTRVGRHVVRCASCSQVVEEVRKLGEAARAIEQPSAPARLRSRIESAARGSASPRLTPAHEASSYDAAPFRDAPHLRPTCTPAPGRRSRTVVGVGLAALAAAMITVLVWPRSSGLQAANTSRLTFSPGRPLPGGTMTVRYQPAPWFKGASRLILIGRFTRPAGHNLQLIGSLFSGFGDSLATLRPSADGTFEGRVTLPTDFLAVSLVVVDSSGEGRDLDGWNPWLAIGGTSTQEPSLDALLAAVEMPARFFSSAESEAPRQSAVAADSLRKYFPDHPSGWAYSRTYGRERGRFDLIRFFQNAQHRYSVVDAELWGKTDLDAERLHDMVVFANNISEPAEAMKWAGRLAREHPEDPRALDDLAGALHEIELREPPHLSDSIRPWLPVLDRAYTASGAPLLRYSHVLSLADAYGDSATKVLWRHRSLDARMQVEPVLYSSATASWEQDRLAAMTRSAARTSCERPVGRYPLYETLRDWRQRCDRDRRFAYGFLSALALQQGNARQALVEADSAIAAVPQRDLCAPTWGYLQHGMASLAVGDTARAETDFVRWGAYYPPSSSIASDRARTHLGARFNEERWLARSDSAHRVAMACLQAQRAATEARRAARGR